MAKDIILELKDVCKSYGRETVLNNVNIKIKKGEIIAITGKSGGGKSTLLKCINNLEKIDSGEIMFKDINIKEMKPEYLRQKIGIVFQEYNLFEHMNVLDNLTIALTEIKHMSKEDSKKEALDILKKIDLLDKVDEYPDKLSGGQKQRIAIARTLLMKPDIILLDEPTSALDKEMKNEVLKLINTLTNENITLIVVSHEEEFVNKISDRIYKLTNHNLKEI